MNKTFWRLLHFTKPLTSWMLLAVLLGIVTIGGGVGLIALSAYIIATAALHPSLAALAFAVIGVRFFGITRGLFRYLERVVSHQVTFRLLAELRVWFYKALEPLVPARLTALAQNRGSEYSSGELLSRFVADIETLQEFYIRVLAPPLVAAIVALVMWAILGAYNAVFALIFLTFFILAGVGVPLLTYFLSRRVGRQMVTVRSALNTTLIDSIQGMADILAFGHEGEQQRTMQRLNQRLIRLQTTMVRVNGLQEALGTLFTNLSLWMILLFGIPLVSTGHLSGISLAVVALAAVASFEAVLPLPVAAQHVGGSLEAARRLFEVVDAQPAVQNGRPQGSPPPSRPASVPTTQNYGIEVQHLHFRYAPQGPDVLDDISFTLPQGQCIALVGPSGVGKSTLANVLLRFWEYEEGHILLGGHELRDYRQDDLHQLISVVEQDTHLFNVSIRENMLIARPDANQEELEQAAKQAHIHDFIQSLPQGYETRIGEQGLNVSGGERQRIAIARALLKNAPILILDEPTANLDVVTEQEILRSLHTLMQGRTTLLITHRLVSLDKTNEILVMQSGKIAERGTHHELLQAAGLYWKLWQLQNHIIAS